MNIRYWEEKEKENGLDKEKSLRKEKRKIKKGDEKKNEEFG